MARRTILIFPNFPNIEVISRIRDTYDPLAKLVAPHITVVFPIESEISDEELRDFLERKLEHVRPFHIRLQGVIKKEDAFGNYLFLQVKEGRDELRQIHDLLYSDELEEYDYGFPYEPHMTIGKLETAQDLQEAYTAVQGINDFFATTVDTISVEMIGDQEESMILFEKKLI